MDGIKGLLSDLDALFGAELARQEDEAADDLAISLRADRHLAEVLTEGPFAVVLDQRTIPLERVGRDFIEGGGFIAPFDRHRFVTSAGERARPTDLSLVECLRSLARAGTPVELALEDGTVDGALVGAAPDHLVVAGKTGVVVVPIGSVRWARLSLEDSTGAS